MAEKHCTGKTRPIKIPTEKWLTIGKFYYYYTPTKDAPPGTPNHPVTVPWMQLKGRWLQAAGFTIGARVRVRVKPGRLVLTVVEE
ncbi:SymE family type I addiction module toxin [Sedimenticola sp.]|uniref:SymE family type I addiction module toxin n=1 Tax=Sedimenticola sp. TaxID=1940285 RepID=UPI003D0CF11F